MTKPTCYHEDKKVVWTTVGADGEALVVKQLRHQCQGCGRLLANALPYSKATSDTPDLDIEALNRWIDYDKGQWSRRREEHKALDTARIAEQRIAYEAYLQSDSWRARREIVFERCGGLCEGCRRQRATQVHHLTYANVGNEFLWELVAVCRECHERVHKL
jgi:5-methylcytosine-specific restriction endonuclease McrA